MAKLTIEIEENEFALYDVVAYIDDYKVMAGGNYTSENAAFNDIYDYVSEYFND